MHTQTPLGHRRAVHLATSGGEKELHGGGLIAGALIGAARVPSLPSTDTCHNCQSADGDSMLKRQVCGRPVRWHTVPTEYRNPLPASIDFTTLSTNGIKIKEIFVM